jgi:hypothetical protein
MSAILRADETLLAFLAHLVQQYGQLHLAEEPTALPVRRPKGTLHTLRRPKTDWQ